MPTLTALARNPFLTANQAALIHQTIRSEQQVLDAAKAAQPGWAGPNPYAWPAVNPYAGIDPNRWKKSLHQQWRDNLPNTNDEGTAFFVDNNMSPYPLSQGCCWALHEGRAYAVAPNGAIMFGTGLVGSGGTLTGSSLGGIPESVSALPILPANVHLFSFQNNSRNSTGWVLFLTYQVVAGEAPGFVGADPYYQPFSMNPVGISRSNNWLASHPNTTREGWSIYQGSPAYGPYWLSPGKYWALNNGQAMQVTAADVARLGGIYMSLSAVPAIPAEVLLMPPAFDREHPMGVVSDWTYSIGPAQSPGFVGANPFNPFQWWDTSKYTAWVNSHPNTTFYGAQVFRVGPTNSNSRIPVGSLVVLQFGRAWVASPQEVRGLFIDLNSVPVLPSNVFLIGVPAGPGTPNIVGAPLIYVMGPAR